MRWKFLLLAGVGLVMATVIAGAGQSGILGVAGHAEDSVHGDALPALTLADAVKQWKNAGQNTLEASVDTDQAAVDETIADYNPIADRLLDGVTKLQQVLRSLVSAFAY